MCSYPGVRFYTFTLKRIFSHSHTYLRVLALINELIYLLISTSIILFLQVFISVSHSVVSYDTIIQIWTDRKLSSLDKTNNVET